LDIKNRKNYKKEKNMHCPCQNAVGTVFHYDVFCPTFAFMKLKEMNPDDRPREKMMEKGAPTLSNAELLAVLLRTGTGKRNALDVAREILKEADGRLTELAGMSVERLCHVDGIGPGKAVTIVAAFELGKRVAAEDGVQKMPQMDSPQRVYTNMLPHLRDIRHEECWVLFLNHANRLIGKEMVSRGGMESTPLDKRVVLRRALDRKASGIILVHNHPSGNPYPSVEDIRQTRELGKALASCDMHLVDHVIVAGRSYYSFSDERVEEN
jgi:DNA repair protein RadC